MYTPGFRDGGTGPTAPAAASIPESFMDIVNYVDANYRTLKDRSHRAICGLSMGGGHSYSISLLYPDMFDYVGLFSAHVPLRDADYPGLQQQFKNKPALYWIAIGKSDFLYDNNKVYREYLDKQGYPYEYIETEDGHIWRNWRNYLTVFAQRLFK
jgi:enterochelin esterase family protein